MFQLYDDGSLCWKSVLSLLSDLVFYLASIWHSIMFESKTSIEKLSNRAIYFRLLSYIKPYKWVFALTLLANLTFAYIEAQFIYLFQPLIDEGLVNKDPDTLTYAPYIFMGMVLARGVANFVSVYGLEWVGRRVIKNLRTELFDKLLLLPAGFFVKNASGEILSKLTFNTERLAKAVTEGIVNTVRHGATVIFLVATMFYTNWKLASIFFVSAPLIGVIVAYAAKRFRRTGERIQTAMGEVTQIASEVIDGYKVIRVYGGIDYERARFEQVNEANRKQVMKFTMTKAVSVPLVQVIAAVGVTIIIYLSTVLIKEGALTAGQFVVMLGAMMAILKPLKQLTTVNSTIQEGIVAVKDIFAIIDQSVEVDQGLQVLEQMQGKVEFKDVSMRYDNANTPAVKNVSFSIEPGKTVAIVGRSGSGKSSTTALLLRFYQPDGGTITIDGHDIQSLTLQSLRGNIAVVSQDVVLFNDTIRNNIAYGNHEATEEAVVRAAQSAYAMEFINSLESGMETRVGEDGAMLSGGQKQRIAIARAFLKDAPVLILDEATSALDTESEREILKALDELVKSKTTIVIAHRLSTIENADSIVVLDKGEVVEQGTHQELLENNAVYANLHKMQKLER